MYLNKIEWQMSAAAMPYPNLRNSRPHEFGEMLEPARWRDNVGSAGF